MKNKEWSEWYLRCCSIAPTSTKDAFRLQRWKWQSSWTCPWAGSLSPPGRLCCPFPLQSAFAQLVLTEHLWWTSQHATRSNQSWTSQIPAWGMENEKHNPDTKSQSQVAGTGATQTPGKDVLYGATSPQGSYLSHPPGQWTGLPTPRQRQAPPTSHSWII